MGRYITTTGTAGNTIRTINSAYSAVVNDRILVDTSAGAITVTLPANGGLFLNDTIQIIDIAGQASTNNITLSRNSSKINNIADDFTIDINYAVITIIYTGSTYGWIVSNA